MASTPFDPSMFDVASGRRLKKSCGPCEPGAELQITPEFLYFGYVQPGAVSDWQPLIIKNTGVVAVGVQPLELTGEFEIDANNPVTLVPGESITYSIRFAPLGNGLRGGDIEINAAVAGEQPLVKLVGIGGQIGSGIGGSGSAWAYRYGAFAVEDIQNSEVLMDYHVTTPHRLQSNFAGCKVSVEEGPEDPFVLRVLKNGAEVGTITINPDKSVTMATALGASVQVPINSIMTVTGPVSVDPLIKRLRMTFVGVV